MWLQTGHNLYECRVTKSNHSACVDQTRWEYPYISHALPYLLLGFSTLLLILVPRILIDDRLYIGTFDVCQLLASTRCGASLWVYGLYGLNLLTLLLLFRESRRRRNAQDVLRTSKAEVRIIEEFSQLGIWSWEPNKNRVHLSGAARKLLSIGPDAPNSLSDFINAFCSEDRRKLERIFVDTARLDQSFTTEVRIVGTGDVVHWIQVSGRLVKDGQLSGNGECIGILIDVSEQKHIREDSEALRRELTHCMRGEVFGDFSGVLVHELKQPLTAILSNAQAAERMLKRSPIDLAQLSETIQDIIRDDSRAGAVIQHLRSLFKGDDKDCSILNVNQIVRDALKIISGALLQKNIELSLSLSEAPLFVRGNRIQLQQLILNLVLNASEAMRENDSHKKLEVITLNDTAGNAIISITDTGPGVPEEIRNRMFDPFFTTKAQGLGLGLSICRSIVVAHGGRINATNDQSRGTTFTVALPITKSGVEWLKMKVPSSSSSMMMQE
jgi:C4-dicarboxylate-specific signal transduction histidine kinase